MDARLTRSAAYPGGPVRAAPTAFSFSLSVSARAAPAERAAGPFLDIHPPPLWERAYKSPQPDGQGREARGTTLFSPGAAGTLGPCNGGEAVPPYLSGGRLRDQSCADVPPPARSARRLSEGGKARLFSHHRLYQGLFYGDRGRLSRANPHKI